MSNPLAELEQLINSTPEPTAVEKAKTHGEFDSGSKPQYVKKKKKKNLWEEDVEALEIDPSTIFRFNRHIMFASVDNPSDKILEQVKAISTIVLKYGFKLRSNGMKENILDATAREVFGDHSETTVAWKKINEDITPDTIGASEKCWQVAKGRHNAWDKIPPAVRAILSANIAALLGDACDAPTTMLIVYSEDGVELSADVDYKTTGNNSFLIQCAEHFLIPVFNLKNDDALSKVSAYIETFAPKSQDTPTDE